MNSDTPEGNSLKGSSSEEERPKDEREFNAGIAVSTPAWLPGINLNISYKRVWEKRATDFIRDVADSANVDEGQVYEQARDASSRFADLLLLTGQRAQAQGDEFYRSSLARLAASALLDYSRIDSIAHVAERIVKLEPIHIRIVSLLPYTLITAAVEDGNLLALQYARLEPGFLPAVANFARLSKIKQAITETISTRGDDRNFLYSDVGPQPRLRVGNLARVVRAEEFLVATALLDLTDVRFIADSRPTTLGVMAGNLINGNLGGSLLSPGTSESD